MQPRRHLRARVAVIAVSIAVVACSVLLVLWLMGGATGSARAGGPSVATSLPSVSLAVPSAETAPATPTPRQASPGATSSANPSASTVAGGEATFAVIGDFGSGNANEAAVARLVASWKPPFIIGLGDVYYASAGGTGSARYDYSVGAFYCAWLKDIRTTGTKCPRGTASKNAFFTTMGNHDLSDASPAPSTYLDYFTLPGSGYQSTSGNERYYDFVEGSVHFFMLNSNPDEPDGVTAGSKQGTWLKTRLAASTSRWNVVVDHHPPFSSDNSHGSTPSMQWPFKQWGADVVLSGHAHTYERISVGGMLYIVNGLGGAPLYNFAADSVEGSQMRFAGAFGAQLVHVSQGALTLDFYDVSGRLIDSSSVRKG